MTVSLKFILRQPWDIGQLHLYNKSCEGIWMEGIWLVVAIDCKVIRFKVQYVWFGVSSGNYNGLGLNVTTGAIGRVFIAITAQTMYFMKHYKCIYVV